jgi:hypothetical protein
VKQGRSAEAKPRSRSICRRPDAIHQARLWRAGQRPELRQEIAEGNVGLAI